MDGSLVLAIVVPLMGLLLAFAVGGRYVEPIALATMALGLATAVAITVAVRQTGGPLVYLLGGWGPPLGVALRADGLSAVMIMTAAVVICAIGVFAHADFGTPAGSRETRAPFAFWILLLAIWAALNTILLGEDLFTLYVALELLTFAAVPVVCLEGRAETVQAALRYLLFALLGSVFYLAGTALLYGTYGTLDIALLRQAVHAEPTTLVAAALMTVGLLAKTALFPLHLWLPPAHAGAPAAGSAVLSALVVKGSFFIVVRLWIDAMPGLPGFAATQLLAGLGAGAVVFGGILALRQNRLKLLIAYSTLAQIGYLFLMFPLAVESGSGQLQSGYALSGGMLQAISHATAKAAMFMSAGVIYAALGHDRIAGLAGVGRALPLSILAFALGGLALVGVPLSGAYVAKELLLLAAAETEQWWWAVVVQAGGILTSSYLFLVLAQALAPTNEPAMPRAPVSRLQEMVALALALCSLLLGLIPWGSYLTVPDRVQFDMLAPAKFAGVLWPIAGGVVLAILMGSWTDQPAKMPIGKALSAIGPARSAALALARIVEGIDGSLRQWRAATVVLVILVIIFCGLLLAAR